MDPALFAAFLAATLVIIATPGPSCALASAQAIKHGPRAMLVCVAGDALGTLVHILVAVASMQALMSVAAQVLPALQIAGGLYIIYLGYKALTSRPGAQAVRASHRSVFLSGFFACVTNPKAIVFFAALFPGFINPELSIATQSLIYGAIFIALDAASIVFYAMLAYTTLTRGVGARLSVDKISGMGLIGVGALLVYKGWRELPAR
ncbi:threonine/homoserine/homoserine lactone efflux protein [Litoreibacter ponti]|uniref:Threonine/homoserine/homoserine lactone efflux protein n=1 Tax=Litoreibacter ponti TaxID=1510457 RepID=A0A2T6BNH2_9RHOB|nr:LysE family translocator [Litoreibacter ponti]PTX57537.1 threonine/homoserine/homoserine lactone efflux protein [Litoreibacter ponti]